MKNKLILLPVLFAFLAMAFVIYKSPSSAEEISGDAEYGRDSDAKSGVPADIYYTKAVKSVVFSHQTHAKDLGFKCSTCHNNLFQMKAKNVESQPDFNMKGLAEGKYCGSCHSSKNNAAFSSDTQCARCHIGVMGLEREEETGNSQEGLT